MKTKIRTGFVLFAIFMLMAGTSANSQENDAAPSAAGSDALRLADIAWSKTAEAQEMDQFYAHFLNDAVVLGPNEPIANGIAEIRKLFDKMFALPGFSISWKPTLAKASESDDLAYSVGTYKLKFDGPDGETIVDHGKYMTVWKKGAGGSWKVAADMFNSNLPLPMGEKEGN